MYSYNYTLTNFGLLLAFIGLFLYIKTFKLNTFALQKQSIMELLIKNVLTKQGISVKELSERLGVTRDACYKYINGNPTISILDKIAKALDVDIRSLISGKDGDDFSAADLNETKKKA